MSNSSGTRDYQPDPEEVGEKLDRQRQLRIDLRAAIDNMVHIDVIGGTPADYDNAKKQLTREIEAITAEMTTVRNWLIREGVLRGGS